MNIFALDDDPVIAARMLCDKHVVKMVLETAQLLSTAQRFYGVEGTYKATHKNHPCSIWVRSSRGNYDWLLEHGLALCAEYTHIYGKVHKCKSIYLNELVNNSMIPINIRQDFVQCMPDIYRTKDPIEAYRNYYKYEKLSFAKWKNRESPRWIHE